MMGASVWAICMTDIPTASGLVQMDRKIRLFLCCPSEGDRQPAGRAGSRPAGVFLAAALVHLAQRAWKRQPTGTSSRLSGLPGIPPARSWARAGGKELQGPGCRGCRARSGSPWPAPPPPVPRVHDADAIAELDHEERSWVMKRMEKLNSPSGHRPSAKSPAVPPHRAPWWARP